MSSDTLPSLSFPVREGSRIDQFVIVSKLGAGGMGVVYKAFDCQLKRQVAIKFMQSHGDSGQSGQRFLREAEITARLNHPHIVRLYQSGMFEQFPYFVMEYIEGATLLTHIASERPGLREQIVVLTKVAEALAFAHSHNIIHRDIKPGNIMVRTNGEPVLMDFGLARVTQVSDLALTRSGEIIGTPEYMAPEQASGIRRKIDAQSDVYSLGAVLYHLLTGRPPVQGDNFLGKIRQLLEEKPRPPRTLCPQLPAALENICCRAMEKDKRLRYASAQAMAEDLRHYVAGQQTCADRYYARRRFTRTAVMAALSLLVVALIWLVRQTKTPGLPPDTRTPQEIAFVRHYEAGLGKLQQHPQEAYIYLTRAADLAEAIGLARDADKWQQLRLALVRAAFASGDHATVYRLSKELLVGADTRLRHELSRYAAWAAYRMQVWEEAQTRWNGLYQTITAASHLSPAEKAERQSEALYYQGLVHMQQNEYIRAADVFQQAIAMPGAQSLPLQNSLCLHYSAAMLANIDQPLSAEQLDNIWRYLQRIDVAHMDSEWLQAVQPYLYNETMARYLLLRTHYHSGEERRQLARQVILLIERCMSNRQPLAVWYFMRGKARMLCGDHREGEQDLVLASEMEPSRMAMLVVQPEAAGSFLQPYRLQSYFTLLPRFVARSFDKPVDFFSDEFRDLQQRHLAGSDPHQRGIVFTTALFHEYYRQLSDGSDEIRQVAMTALGNLIPHEQTLAALEREASAAVPELQKKIQEIAAKIRRQNADKQRRRLSYSLTQVPWHVSLFEMRPFYAHDVETLQRLLHEEDDLLLCYLAAKVLVRMPSLEVRRGLCRVYLETPNDWQSRRALAKKILLAAAFREIGYHHLLLEPDFASWLWGHLEKYRGDIFSSHAKEDEFLQTLLTFVLPTHDRNTVHILDWLVQYGSERVKIAAASRFYWPGVLAKDFPPIFSRLLSFLRQGSEHGDPQFQAAVLLALARYLSSADMVVQEDWQAVVANHFMDEKYMASVGKALQRPHPQLRHAILHFWRNLLPVILALKKESLFVNMQEALRPLWQAGDPMLRYQAILLSSELWDEQVFTQIAFAPQAQLFERLTALLGAAGAPTANAEKALWWWRQVKTQKLLYDANWRLVTTMVYMLSHEGKGNLIAGRIAELLKNENAEVRFVAVVSAGYLRKLPAGMVAQLKHLARKDPLAHVRAPALGVLIDYALQNKDQQTIDNCRKAVRQYQGEDREDFCISVAWGCSLAWEHALLEITQYGLERWDPEQIVEYTTKKILRASAEQRQDFRRRLECGLEMVADFPHQQIFRDYGCWLVALLEAEQDCQSGIAWAHKMMNLLASKDSRFTYLWARMMARQNKAAEAMSVLQQKLSHHGANVGVVSDAWPDQQYEAQLRRSLALIYRILGENTGKQETELMGQYLLAPELSLSLMLLGEHCYETGQYDKAYGVFQEVQRRWHKNGELAVWLARLHARRQEPSRLIFYIGQARKLKQVVTLAEWQRYEEVRPYLEQPEVREQFNDK